MATAPQILNERAATLLKKLVSSYISDGQPVGSKQLANMAGLDISSATIRNVMSGLEKNGLVRAPHTSAGKIPTEKGIRMFVDTLLEVQPLQKQLLDKLKAQLNPDQDKETLINQANQIVAELTHMAGVISVPKNSQSKLRHIEFLPLPDSKVLAIMVTNEKEVQNRVVHMERDYSISQLQAASNYLNQHFSGQDIFSVRNEVLSDLKRTRSDMDEIMRTAIEVAGRALPNFEESDRPYLVQGKSNLVRYSAGNDMQQLQHMLDMFDQKREMLGLLDRCIHAEGVKIFIGHEVGVEGLGDCSVVSAPYSVNGKTLGVLGVIGPTRINYDRVIPVVDVTARLLGEALKS
ncbi:MAG: heat-inducible transcriptional repressor HrcA [Gammaproteobacteria bacterium]|nr:heat-inducible transcriptional repressor HrcA [Gammaproteobacteria bacterium]